MRARVRFIRARACVSACIQPEGRNGSCTPTVTRERRTRNRARCLAALSFFFLRFSVPNECLISSVPVVESVFRAVLGARRHFFLFFLRISVPNERLISGVPVESAGASVLLDAGCVPHTDRWSLANVRGRCGRSAPRAAKPQKADQCSGSSLRWVVFCRHFIGPRA